MTDISLKEYFETRFCELEKRLNLRYTTQDDALIGARVELERRLEGMNEFRHDLEKQAATFITRDRYEVAQDAMVGRIESLESWRAGSEGKVSRANLIAAVAVGVSLILGIIGLLK